MNEGRQLLVEYAETGSETAFRELVSRYVDLVYSAAVRLVNGDTHLAEDVTQTVFADLAKVAGSLKREVMLGGWLHRHTCFVASKTLRAERRRLVRERQAVEMNLSEDHSAANLAQVAPLLDDAINQLGAKDRTAILLRFFEQRDLGAVGAALGSNEQAARKRIDRALDKLEALLKRRGVALSAAALAAALSTQAVAAAPAGLAVTVTTAALSGTAASGGLTITFLKIMSMTKMKVGIVTAVIAVGVTAPWVVQHQTHSQLTKASQELSQRNAELSHLAQENERLSNLVAQASVAAPAPTTNPSAEVLKLRGEVGRLRQETIAAESGRTNAPSALSGLRENPGMWKLIRDQQKAGMGIIYKDFAKRVNLDKEQGEKLTEVLADNVMENVDRITEVLRDRKSPEEADAVFAAQEAVLAEKIQALLGPEGATQYHEFTKNLASHLTAQQFKGMMTGEQEAKDAKAKQLYELMLAETQRTLASAGLPPDFQTVPNLNFRNFASETEAEKNLKLLEGIYDRVADQAGAFLDSEEIGKFAQFRTTAVNNNRMALALNRKLMAPGGGGK